MHSFVELSTLESGHLNVWLYYRIHTNEHGWEKTL